MAWTSRPTTIELLFLTNERGGEQKKSQLLAQGFVARIYVGGRCWYYCDDYVGGGGW